MGLERERERQTKGMKKKGHMIEPEKPPKMSSHVSSKYITNFSILKCL